MTFREIILENDFTENPIIKKIIKIVGTWDKNIDQDTRTPKELLIQIKQLPDSTLKKWSKGRVHIGTWRKMFQDKAVRKEMQRRGIEEVK